MNALRTLAWMCFAMLVTGATSFGEGGPPLIGDDPGTPGNGKIEVNVAYPYLQTERATTMDLGYVDANYGLGDHIELSYQGGVLLGKNTGQGWHGGYDNSLLGLKWRFLDQDFRSNNLILDTGARVNLVEHVQLLFAAGRGLRNDGDSPHLYLYAGLGFTF